MNSKSLYIVIILLITSCNLSNRRECGFVSMKRLFVDKQYGNDRESFNHYVFINKFYKECLDSTTICKIAQVYADTITDYKPIGVLKFYGSLENYNSKGEKSQYSVFDNDCLVEIFFDINTAKIKSFGFYDSNGENYINTLYWSAINMYKK